MAAKLDIEYIEIKNFLSYGDYVTRLDVGDLGPVLILGEFESEDGDVGSNGAGKSSLLTAFIWCLFGRTITNPNPGDKVVNWNSKKNCYVKLKTTDGWEIIRTRKFDNHSELILRRDGDDATQSTNTNAQKHLNELFGLDYEIFISSMFCGQFGKPFLEMSPVKRKAAIERLLGLDRLNDLADKAKTQFKQVETRQEVTRNKIDTLKEDLGRQETRLETNVGSKEKFQQNHQAKIDGIKDQLQEVCKVFEEIDVPNISKLEKEWESFNKVESDILEISRRIKENKNQIALVEVEISEIEKRKKPITYEVPDIEELRSANELYQKAQRFLEKLTSQSAEVKGEIRCVEQDVVRMEKIIQSWEERSDTNCESCEQPIGSDHIHQKTDEIKEKLQSLSSQKNELLKKQESILSNIEIIQEKAVQPQMSLVEAERLTKLNKDLLENFELLGVRKSNYLKAKSDLEEENEMLSEAIVDLQEHRSLSYPGFTLEEARNLKFSKDTLQQKIDGLELRLIEVGAEVNPYVAIIEELEETILELNGKVEELEKEVGQLDVLFKHYKYIHRSYSDRKKIKGWLLSELIPFLNNRIQYYLDMFDINIKIEFDTTLGTNTDCWDYEFCSGGERKRIDLAVMFGLYDLHASIYGQQCNIMVLDEVDSKLDGKGVNSFADVIHDIGNSGERPHPGTIFVISHKQELQNLFAAQIMINKVDGFSKIAQTKI